MPRNNSKSPRNKKWGKTPGPGKQQPNGNRAVSRRNDSMSRNTKRKNSNSSSRKGDVRKGNNAYIESQKDDRKWYEKLGSKLPSGDHSTGVRNKSFKLTLKQASAFMDKGTNALKEEVDRFSDEKSKIQDKGEKRWFAKVMSSGALADKVAALTLAVQESPVHNLPYLDRLIAMSQKKKAAREQSISMEALKDLFLAVLLPKARKLVSFKERLNLHYATWKKKKKKSSSIRRKKNKVKEGAQSSNADDEADATQFSPTKEELAFWLFEDQLKVRYGQFLEQLRRALHDSQEYVKKSTLGYCHDLLVGRPEQEQALLSMIINKLGDPIKKIASQSVFLVHKILKKHPGMKIAVVKEVEHMLFRPNITDRGKYYGLICLNQIIFSRSSVCRQAAGYMIKVYLSVFNSLLDNGESVQETMGKKKKDPRRRQKSSSNIMTTTNPRMVAALLTGIHRAVPFAGEDYVEEISDASSVLFRVVHQSSLPAATQALAVLFQLLPEANDDHDYDDNTSKNEENGATQLSSRKGKNEEYKHTDGNHDDLEEEHPNHDGGSTLTKRFYRALYAKILSLRGPTGHRCLTMLLNLLFKAMMRDLNTERIAAFIKRILQVCGVVPPHVACALLYLVANVGSKARSIVDSLMKNEEEEEEEEEEMGGGGGGGKEDEDGKSTSKDNVAAVGNRCKKCYDPQKREPLHAKAGASCLWEATLLSMSYFHPGVTKFTQDILPLETAFMLMDQDNRMSGEGSSSHDISKKMKMRRLQKRSNSYSGDPLVDFTNIAFLDRFVFRNPKKMDKKDDANKGGIFAKQQQAAASSSSFSTNHNQPVNTDEFINQQESQVATHERFFYKYFKLKAAAERKMLSHDDDDDDDDDDDEEEEEDDEELVNDFKTSSSSSAKASSYLLSANMEEEEEEEEDDMASSSDANSEEIDEYFDLLMEKELRKQAKGDDPDMPDEFLDPDIDDDNDDDYEAHHQVHDDDDDDDSDADFDDFAAVKGGNDDANDDHQEDVMEEEDGDNDDDDDDKNRPIPDAHTLDSSGNDDNDYDDSDDDDDEEAAEQEALQEMMMMGNEGGKRRSMGDTDDDEDDEEEDDDLFNALAAESDEDESDFGDYDDNDDNEKNNDRTFAAAEEFAQLLESNPRTKAAGRKQLEWEAKAAVTSSSVHKGKRKNRSSSSSKSNSGELGKKGMRSHDDKIQHKKKKNGFRITSIGSAVPAASKGKKNKRTLSLTPKKSGSRSTPNFRKKRQKTRK